MIIVYGDHLRQSYFYGDILSFKETSSVDHSDIGTTQDDHGLWRPLQLIIVILGPLKMI